MKSKSGQKERISIFLSWVNAARPEIPLTEKKLKSIIKRWPQMAPRGELDPMNIAARLIGLYCGRGIGLPPRKPKSGPRTEISPISVSASVVGEVSLQHHQSTLDRLQNAYERKKAVQAQKNAEAVRVTQEIGDLPDVVDMDRKNTCRTDFKSYCEKYHPETFVLKWSPDHLRVIDKIEDAVLRGGLFALAMPRGSGKTALCTAAVEWAALYGHARFISLIASSSERAESLLDGIKTTIETSDRLAEDFPEVCVPIRKLERIIARSGGQRYHGVHTRIEWTARYVKFPTIEGAASSGVVLFTSGMKGSEIRGQRVIDPETGETLRPELFLADDIQTTESALSETQTKKRVSAMMGDVLGMAGPGKKIAGLATMTVIAPNDAAEQLLDRDKNPEWKGERMKLVYSFPKNESLWDQYSEIRNASFKNDGDGSEATSFYLEHREDMDEGADIAWPERFNDGEMSAIQHAMNLRYRNYDAFMAEYQNEPVEIDYGSALLTSDEIANKLNGFARFEIPESATWLTAFVDVQKDCLYYLVAAWENNFTGYVVDYGTWPDQGRRYFVLRDARQTLGKAFPDAGLEGSIYSGLDALMDKLFSTQWKIDGDSDVRLDRVFIDSAWGQSTEVVYRFSTRSTHSSVIYPYHGIFIGGSGTPFSESAPRPGDQIGHHWKIPRPKPGRGRLVLSDVNYWKSFLQARFGTPIGDAGSLSLYGKEPLEHLMLSEHMTSEYSVPVTGNGRTVEEWKMKGRHIDNHLLDCLAGAACAASVCGSELKAHVKNREMGPVSFSKLQRKISYTDNTPVASREDEPISFAEMQRRAKTSNEK